MNNCSRIGLGTVQFGLPYGVSNCAGKPGEEEVAAILRCAAEAGIGTLDTAAGYGDSEAVIGRNLPAGRKMRIVTKMPPVDGDTVGAADRRRWVEAMSASLERLKVASVDAVLIHRAADLAKPGWEHLVDALQEAKSRGWTAHIGASVYDAAQLTLVESRFAPELVQMPFNVLDRRPLETGMLTRLKDAGVEIHARSVFLQGLLLMEPAAMPEFFSPVRDKIAALQSHWRGLGLSPLAGCLAFALQQPEIDMIIVGVNRRSELEEIITAVQSEGITDIAFGPPPNADPVYLDPSRWPVFA